MPEHTDRGTYQTGTTSPRPPMDSIPTPRYRRDNADNMGIIERIEREQLRNTLSDEPVMTTADFVEMTDDIEAPMWFATSRSGKRSPYRDIDHIGAMCADSLSLLGLEPDDGLLNLLAPRPHLSGFAAVTGGKYLGARVLNDHFEDVYQVIEDGHATEAVAMVAVPSMAIDKARAISERYEDPRSLFPHLELGMVGGEMVYPALRREVKETWGLGHAREFYGSSEVGLVAAGIDESRRLVPQLQHFVIELEVDDEIIDIRDLEETTDGSILLTSPHRKAIDLVRYRQGDHVRVHPAGDIPRIEPLGRADNAVNLAGALLHPGDLYKAIHATFGPVVEAVPLVYDSEPPTTLEVFVIGADGDRTESFLELLVALNDALGYALSNDNRELLTVTYVDEPDAIPVSLPEGWRYQQVVFERELPRD